ncbi:hypothetical protein KFE25_001393 [Diacronema lutheri]|uniref:UBC core domain-containing protein n=1 Tax=Diacronema lutheri TaxID=2081491 RepID=A0A7R9UNT8_DIALT|nr:hypothetical protein KFE25_001393 [Diacronema lutheri]|mmetsp:Transcript_18532/g.57732  ORF Transcript_18532/g.57732 Transcript_18532/m.57732 type:complete len:188 (+) Transcript_18532:56-619(+)
MIKLFSLKQQKAEEEKAAAEGKTKASAGQIRMQKDLSELTLGKGVELEFHMGADNLMEFKVHVMPDDGMYKGGRFTFDFKVSPSYPHEPPKVLCETTVYHPNIDMEGHVCLNILREDWKPVLTINSVIYGLTFLMLEPNADDPLNKEAATMLEQNRKQFEQIVRRTLRGGQMKVGAQTYSFASLVRD